MINFYRNNTFVQKELTSGYWLQRRFRRLNRKSDPSDFDFDGLNKIHPWWYKISKRYDMGMIP